DQIDRRGRRARCELAEDLAALDVPDAPPRDRRLHDQLGARGRQRLGEALRLIAHACEQRHDFETPPGTPRAPPIGGAATAGAAYLPTGIGSRSDRLATASRFVPPV